MKIKSLKLKSKILRIKSLRDNKMSHVSGIDMGDFNFRKVCTGDGPINRTMSSLAVSFDESLWQLYCLELERFVKTESISGGPYRRLENIGRTSASSENGLMFKRFKLPTAILSNDLLTEFLQYLFKSNILKFKFVNGCYGLAHSFIETVILISNCFIEWYNDKYRKDATLLPFDALKEANVLKQVVISENNMYYVSNNFKPVEYYENYNGQELFKFKGNPVCLNITDLADASRNDSTILSLEYIEPCVRTILTLLNCDYGNSKKTNSGIDKGKTRFEI